MDQARQTNAEKARSPAQTTAGGASEAHSASTEDPWTALERLLERRDRESARDSGGDSEEPREAPFRPTRSTQPTARSDTRIPAGLAFDRLRGAFVRPFERVPVRVRQRAEERTGRTLEESYEGFTNLVASAILEYLGDDKSVFGRDHRRRT